MDTKLSQKIMELDLATHHALTTLDTRGTLSLKNRILFLLRHKQKAPQELMSALDICKTNLHTIAKNMIACGLIKSSTFDFDKRLIEYTITELGKTKIDELLQKIENVFKNIVTTEQEVQAATDNIDKILDLLSYL